MNVLATSSQPMFVTALFYVISIAAAAVSAGTILLMVAWAFSPIYYLVRAIARAIDRPAQARRAEIVRRSDFERARILRNEISRRADQTLEDMRRAADFFDRHRR